MLNLDEGACYHEAGHAVAAVFAGYRRILNLNEHELVFGRPISMMVQENGTGTVKYGEHDGFSIASSRRALIRVVAGPLAQFLYEGASQSQLLSVQLKEGLEWGGHDSDLSNARQLATEICRRLRLQSECKWKEQSGNQHIGIENSDAFYWRFQGIEPPQLTDEELIAEVVRAERWAERILKRQWPAVEALVAAICRSPTGQLWGQEIQHVIQSEVDNDLTFGVNSVMLSRKR